MLQPFRRIYLSVLNVMRYNMCVILLPIFFFVSAFKIPTISIYCVCVRINKYEQLRGLSLHKTLFYVIIKLQLHTTYCLIYYTFCIYYFSRLIYVVETKTDMGKMCSNAVQLRLCFTTPNSCRLTRGNRYRRYYCYDNCRKHFIALR